MSKVADLHEKWSREPDYREAYDGLGPEFELAKSLIEARTRARLTQAELAERMQTTQSVIARLESGRSRPSTRTLDKIAQRRPEPLLVRAQLQQARHHPRPRHRRRACALPKAGGDRPLCRRDGRAGAHGGARPRLRDPARGQPRPRDDLDHALRPHRPARRLPGRRPRGHGRRRPHEHLRRRRPPAGAYRRAPGLHARLRTGGDGHHAGALRPQPHRPRRPCDHLHAGSRRRHAHHDAPLLVRQPGHPTTGSPQPLRRTAGPHRLPSERRLHRHAVLLEPGRGRPSRPHHRLDDRRRLLPFLRRLRLRRRHRRHHRPVRSRNVGGRARRLLLPLHQGPHLRRGHRTAPLHLPGQLAARPPRERPIGRARLLPRGRAPPTSAPRSPIPAHSASSTRRRSRSGGPPPSSASTTSRSTKTLDCAATRSSPWPKRE